MLDIDDTNLNPIGKIKVIGVGGGGISAVNQMISNELKYMEFIAVDTDAKTLENSQAPRRIHITENAMKNSEQILHSIEATDMIFVVAGMGGKAGTSIAPIIAKYSKELGALTVAVVTRPFEDEKRNKNADAGIKNLNNHSDLVVVVSGDKILQANENISKEQALNIADDVLFKTVQGIANLILIPGMINLDFGDLCTILGNAGIAFVGIGEASGKNASVKAVQVALDCPLLEKMQDATSIVINFMGSDESFSMAEVNEASNLIQDAAKSEAEIMWGMSIDESLGDTVRVMIIATRFNGEPVADYCSKWQTQNVPPKSKNIKSDDDNTIEVPPWMR